MKCKYVCYTDNLNTRLVPITLNAKYICNSFKLF